MAYTINTRKQRKELWDDKLNITAVLRPQTPKLTPSLASALVSSTAPVLSTALTSFTYNSLLSYTVNNPACDQSCGLGAIVAVSTALATSAPGAIFGPATINTNGVITVDAMYTGTGITFLELNISNTSTMATPDVYRIPATLLQTAGTWGTYTYDLSQAPTTVGTVNYSLPVYYSITLIHGASVVTLNLGKVSVYDSANDLLTRTFRLGCITNISSANSIKVGDIICGDVVANDPTLSLDVETSESNPEFSELFQNIVATKDVLTGRHQVLRAPVVAVTINGIQFGSIAMPVLSTDRCLPVIVQDTSCETSDQPISTLKEISVDSLNQDIAANSFVLTRTNFGATNSNLLLVNSAFIGKTLAVEYYADELADTYATTSSMTYKKVDLYIPVFYNGGKEGEKVFKNVILADYSETLSRGQDFVSSKFKIAVPATNGVFQLLKVFK